MADFNIKCPIHYPMKCNLTQTEQKLLEGPEKYKVFFMYQFKDNDNWLVPTVEGYFKSSRYRLINADKEPGLGVKICKICRLSLNADFGIAALTPENYNVFLEIGLMRGLQKPVVLLWNPKKQKEVELPFDISDQICIKYETADDLRQGLEREITPFVESVVLTTAFEREFRNNIQTKFNNLSELAKQSLRSLLLERGRPFTLPKKVCIVGLQKPAARPKEEEALAELVDAGFVFREAKTPGHLKCCYFINDEYRPVLEEIAFAYNTE